MREGLREQLNTEITRKQFLQYMTGALLMVFGLNNLVSLLTGGKIIERQVMLSPPGGNDRDGFGSRRFGT